MAIIDEIFKGGVEGLFSGLRQIVAAFKADPTIVAQNAAKLAELEVQLRTAELQAEVALSQAQNKVNELEAASQDKFVTRWRPAVGWICAAGLAYATVVGPTLGWLGENGLNWRTPPQLNLEVLTTTLFAMLGIAGMRSFDKLKGTSK